MSNLPSQTKLAWMCRRGLLELDLILRKIIQDRYPHLTDGEKQVFCDFLDTADTQLLRYLLGQDQVDPKGDPALASLLQKIT